MNVVKTPKGPSTGAKPINGFQIISIREFNDNVNISDTIKYAPHQLYFDLIVVYTKGKGKHNVDFVDYDYEPGTIFIIKKNQCHHWYPNAEKNGFLLFFTEGFEKSLLYDFTSVIFSNKNLVLPNPVIHLLGAQKQQNYFKHLQLISEEMKEPENKVLPFLLSGFIKKLEAEYIDKHPSLNHNQELVLFQEFQEVLNQEIKNSRNGNYFASKLNTTFHNLNRICKIFTASTLKHYIDNFIITKAKTKINNTEKNISDIAYELGFQEVGNFSKFFKKHTGQTPNTFRNQ